MKTSVYIYLVLDHSGGLRADPAEPFTRDGAGTVLTLIGLLLSEGKLHWKEEHTMKQELDKCVLVIDEAMPRGLAANTAAILGITWGRLRPELVGET